MAGRHMDDGCSKRFDIGTLDLRTEGYDSLHTTARPMGGPMGHLVPPTSALPPLAVPPIGGGGLLAPIPPSLRTDPNHGHAWGR